MGSGTSGKPDYHKRTSMTAQDGGYNRRLDAVREVQDQRGNTITLDVPLAYGIDAVGRVDSMGLTDKQQKTLEEWEGKRGANKIEFGAFMDDNGNIICESKGGSGGVGMTYNMFPKATWMTHNHPRNDRDEAGMIGGTFSDADIRNWAKYKNHIGKRARAAEGTYSIAKGNNFNREVVAAYKAEGERLMQEFRATRAKINKLYSDGYITYDETKKMDARAFNTYLIGCHNWLKNNQKTYGYKYQLERNKT